jgi:aryl sulfotransferase
MVELRRYRTLVSDSALWAEFTFNGDIIISPPAKCGTTWMQMLCALLIFDTADLHRPLTEISPWFDAVTYDFGETRATLDAQDHRRFVKTHTPLDGLPFDERATYICIGRDPRDAMVSLEHAMDNVALEKMAETWAAAGVDPESLPPPPDDPRTRFRQWVDGDLVDDDPTIIPSTLANLVHHVRTFWDRRDEPQIELFHYADLLADLPGQLGRLARVLSVDVSAERIDQLAAAATFRSMRDRADELAPAVDSELWRDNRAFFRSGTSGQWRDLLDGDDLDHYRRRVAELAPPDMAEWLHAGWLASTPSASTP